MLESQNSTVRPPPPLFHQTQTLQIEEKHHERKRNVSPLMSGRNGQRCSVHSAAESSVEGSSLHNLARLWVWPLTSLCGRHVRKDS